MVCEHSAGSRLGSELGWACTGRVGLMTSPWGQDMKFPEAQGYLQIEDLEELGAYTNLLKETIQNYYIICL